MSATDEELVKVHIDLGDNPDAGGEAMFAKPLGNDLFELRNNPFHAYDFNFLDVVEAREDAPNLKPSVKRVVTRSGHRTIWLEFRETIPREDRVTLMNELHAWQAFFEGKDSIYFSIDVEPEGDYDRTLARIEEWRRAGKLKFYRTGPRDIDVRNA